ncbi:type VII secretion protein EccB [Dactylosporangium darangshiense]|uniref:Type VII secretion protein EccB n=1 Tax=Dactylosporangium darangshiense TaxID=579108 RepID=A0ABP8DGZ4_9ACTN
MPSRREQIQSHQHAMQRVVGAFVAGDAEPAQEPTRRLGAAAFAGLLVAAVALAGAGVFGLLRPGGSTGWKHEDAVVIERETGTRYVYRGGLLYPVANFSSAVLAVGRAPEPVIVSRASLSGTARGPLIGIAGAPDALPAADRLLRDAWSVCATSGRDSGGATTVTSEVLVARAPSGGTDLGDAGILVRENGSQKVYLVWHGRRFAINSKQALTALNVDAQPRIPVDDAWLNTVPVGLQITQPPVEGRGKASTPLPSYLVGQVITVDGAGYLVRQADLLPLTPVEQAMILADPNTASAYPNATPAAKTVQAADIAAVTKATRPPASDLDPPAQPPAMASADAARMICTTFADGQAAPKFVLNADPRPGGEGIATNGSATDLVADRVLVPPASGVLVRSAQSSEADSGTLFLVTDQGRRFAVPGTEPLAWFGYGGAKPIELPANVVARIPAGPALDPRAARRPLTG